ncbi:MAG: hypothetical protein ABI346_02370 [Candidatus Baltobacteraceae bacterium]
MALGSDGDAYFNDIRGGNIGKIDPHGNYSLEKLPDAEIASALALGADKNMWYIAWKP